VAVGPGGEGQEHGFPQERQVGAEPRRPEPRPQVGGQAALHQGADQLAEGAGQRVFLAAGLDLVELHLDGHKRRGSGPVKRTPADRNSFTHLLIGEIHQHHHTVIMYVNILHSQLCVYIL